jgi:hypothetical protein
MPIKLFLSETVSAIRMCRTNEKEWTMMTEWHRRWAKQQKIRRARFNFLLSKRWKWMSWDTSVGIATGYGFDSRGLIPGRGKRCSVVYSLQTGSGAHPASYPMGTGGRFPRRGVKLTTHLHLVPRSRMLELYLHFLICLPGVVFN